jgi:hypothetical protein
MSIAIRKLQGIGLIMLVTFCFLIAYPISLKVSATRAELQKVEQQIAETRKRNRMLEGDIAVLANVRQLDRWNREYLGYVAPTPDQYLSGERALANLDRLRPPADSAPEAPVLMALRDDVDPVRRQTVSVTSNGEDDGDEGGDLSINDVAPRRLALVDRSTVSDRALRDIARTIPVAAVGGPR